jgi:hypothetical protein
MTKFIDSGSEPDRRMNEESDKERLTEESPQEAGERDLRYGDATGTQRDRSSAEEDGYLDPDGSGLEDPPADEEPAGQGPGKRNLRYGDPFGTQRDRSRSEEGGYLDSEFGSREFTPPGEDEPPNRDK